VYSQIAQKLELNYYKRTEISSAKKFNSLTKQIVKVGWEPM